MNAAQSRGYVMTPTAKSPGALKNWVQRQIIHPGTARRLHGVKMVKEKYEDITPREARAMLGLVDKYQRGQRKDIVAKIDEAVDEFGFQPWFSRVAWSTDGTLLDGQHTLEWIAQQMGGRYKVRVVTGVPRGMIRLLGGAASRGWTARDRLSVVMQRSLHNEEISIANHMAVIVDGGDAYCGDREKQRRVERWEPVNVAARNIPRKLPSGVTLRKAAVAGPMGLAWLMDREATMAFCEEMTGDRAMSIASKLLTNILGQDWVYGPVTTHKIKQQSIKVMKCIEVGCGFSPPLKQIKADAATVGRWKKWADEALGELEQASV